MDALLRSTTWPTPAPLHLQSRSVALREAFRSTRVLRRYETKVLQRDGCWPWLGALTSHGHGRFWIGRLPAVDRPRQDLCVIAHRFAYAIAFGADALEEAPVLAHRCDEAWCQNPDHLEVSTPGDNYADWLARRWHPRSPLRDIRGQHGRALAVRDAGRQGLDVSAAMAVGVSSLDQHQLTLW